MRVVAAKFADRRIASAVGDILRRRMHLAPFDVDIAPLAAEEPTTDDTVLAARFPDQVAGEATAFLRDAGGEIVANVDERWILPRGGTAPAWGSTLRRERVYL